MKFWQHEFPFISNPTGKILTSAPFLTLFPLELHLNCMKLNWNDWQATPMLAFYHRRHWHKKFFNFWHFSYYNLKCKFACIFSYRQKYIILARKICCVVPPARFLSKDNIISWPIKHWSGRISQKNMIKLSVGNFRLISPLRPHLLLLKIKRIFWSISLVWLEICNLKKVNLVGQTLL